MGLWSSMKRLVGLSQAAPRHNLIGAPATSNYRPSYGALPLWGTSSWGIFSLAYVDEMRQDPQVRLCLSYKQAPLFLAEFDVETSDPRAQEFIQRTLERFWQKSLPYAVESYAYGYMPGEYVYRHEKGLVEFDYVRPIHPRDAKVFTHEGKIAWVRVTHMGVDGNVDLEGAQPGRPAKGFWLTHDPTYNQFFGRPALMSAWFPWRLKVMKDGGMDILFKWAYKHSISCTIVRHPSRYYDEGQGRTISAQDLAMQMVEQVKSGGVIAMPSERDEKGTGFLWDVQQWAKMEGQADGLIGYLDVLDKQIQRAILIPDEVITHEGSTGGYSRSMVAATAFYLGAEQSLNHILETFDEQCLKPLVAMNFGKGVTYKVKPKPLTPPDPNNPQGQPGQPGAPPGPGGQPGAPGGGAPPAPMGAAPPGGAPPAGGDEDFSKFAQLSMAWKNQATGEIRYQDKAPGDRSGTAGQWQAVTPNLPAGPGAAAPKQQPQGAAAAAPKPAAGGNQPAAEGQESAKTHPVESQIHPQRLKQAHELIAKYQNHPTHTARIEKDRKGQVAVVVRDNRTGRPDPEQSRLVQGASPAQGQGTPDSKNGEKPMQVLVGQGAAAMPPGTAHLDQLHQRLQSGESMHGGSVEEMAAEKLHERGFRDRAHTKQALMLTDALRTQGLEGEDLRRAVDQQIDKHYPAPHQAEFKPAPKGASGEDEERHWTRELTRNMKQRGHDVNMDQARQVVKGVLERARQGGQKVREANDLPGDEEIDRRVQQMAKRGINPQEARQRLEGALNTYQARHPGRLQTTPKVDVTAELTKHLEGLGAKEQPAQVLPAEQPKPSAAKPGAPQMKPHGHFIGNKHFAGAEATNAVLGKVRELEGQMKKHIAAGGQVVLHRDGQKIPLKNVGGNRWVDEKGQQHGLGGISADQTGKEGVEFVGGPKAAPMGATKPAAGVAAKPATAARKPEWYEEESPFVGGEPYDPKGRGLEGPKGALPGARQPGKALRQASPEAQAYMKNLDEEGHRMLAEQEQRRGKRPEILPVEERKRTAKLHELPLQKVLARIQKAPDGRYVFKHTKGMQEFGSRQQAEAWLKSKHAKAVRQHGERAAQLSRHLPISLEEPDSGLPV